MTPVNTRVGGLGARSALVAALCLLLAAVGLTTPAPAHADATLTLDGRGFGHGHGMSQWGAKGRADAGQSWTQILGAYYPGTTLSSISENTVLRVRVLSDTDNVTEVVAEPGLRLQTNGGTALLPARVSGAEPTRWRLRMVSGALTLEALAGGSWRAHGDTRVAAVLRGRHHADFTAPDATVRLVLGSTHREYHGSVRAVREPGSSTRLHSVVLTTLRNYLPPVVTAEMPSSWAANALRAQAVAARTYALADRAAKPSSAVFDTCDTTQCQVFNGRADYTASGSLIRSYSVASTVDAVRATSGRHLTHGGVPAFTQFSASNGGFSVAGSRPYLQAAADPFDALAPWSATLSAGRLQGAYPSIGRFTSVSTTRDGRGAHGGRVTTIRVNGTAGSVSVSGNQFRTTFGLRSTLFRTSVSGAPLLGGPRDILGDAASDMIGVSGDTVLGWRNTGPAAFAARQTLGTGLRAHPVRTSVHGLSGSGRPEVLYVDSTNGRLMSRPVSTSGQLASQRVVDSGDWRRYDLLIGTRNFAGRGSGLLARDSRTGDVTFFMGDNRGGVQAGRVAARSWSGLRLVAFVGDWDGDGRGDLVASDASNRLFLYPGNGSGGFQPRRVLDSGDWSSRTSILGGGGDVDLDGLPDFVTTTRWGQLHLYGSDGRSGFAVNRRLAAGGWGSITLLG